MILSPYLQEIKKAGSFEPTLAFTIWVVYSENSIVKSL